MAASKAIGFLNFKFGADLGGFEKAMTKAQKGLNKFGKKIQQTGKKLTTSLTLPILALGAVSLKTFADFEQSMLKVKAISGATDSEFKALTDSAKLLGSTTMFTATQVSELQLNLSKLGLTPTEINKSSGAILNLAQATDSDLAEAATVAASTMNAFGLEAQDMTMISDVMADAFSSTALDLTKFETAMGSVAPVAKQAGQDIQGTSAILGVLVNNGVEASTAGTALRNIFLDLANEGLTWDQAMQRIQGSLNPLQTAMDLFGKRGATVATVIANNGAEIQDLTADFNDSSGEAQAMADIMDSGVAGAMRRMKSQLEGVAIELGQQLVPIFTKVIEKVQKAVTWFSSLSESQKENIVKWGLIIAAVGPLLVLFGKLSVGLGSVIGMFKGLSKFIMANPYLAAAAAIIVLATAVYKLSKAFNSNVNVQKTIAGVEAMAAKSTQSDIVNIKLLTGRIEDETTSLDDKRTALIKLQRAYPGYYTEIDNSFKSTAALTAETNRLTTTLMDNAMMNAAKKNLEETLGAIMELETGMEGGGDKTLLETWFGTSGTIGGDWIRAGRKKMDKEELKSLKTKLTVFEKLYKEFSEKVAAGSPMPGTDIPTVKHKKTVILDGDEGTETEAQKKARLKKEEDLAEKSLKNIAELNQEYALITTGINDKALQRKHKQSIVALQQEKQNLLDGVADTETAEQEKQAIKDLYNEKIKQQRAENATEEKAALALSKTKWEEWADDLGEDFANVMNKIQSVFSAVSDALGSLSDKQDAIFANWEKNQQKKITTLEEEEAAEKERIENSIMSAEEKTNALINLEQFYADEIGAIESDIADKSLALQQEQARREKAMNVFSALMSTATAVVAALGMKPWSVANFALAAAVGILGGIQVANIMSTPIPMAQGGIVTGPTTALIGEAGPEAILPLDRLSQIIGEQHITVTGKLIGNDIYLSNKKAEFNRVRTV